MSENYKGNYAPDLFNEAKRYQTFQAQQGASLTDAELRDLHNISNNLLRRYIQEQVGDCAIDTGFKVIENTSDQSNNFKITGGDGTLDNPGSYYLRGYHLFLKSNIAYKDQTSSGSLVDDTYTTSTISALITPTGSSATMRSVTNQGTDFYAAGVSGNIQKTVDCGRNWSNVIGDPHSLNAIDMGDSSTGYAVGEYGVVLKTSNGGNSWTHISASLPSPYLNNNFQDLSFVSATTGWIVGEAGAILKTVNGGSSWTAQGVGISTEDLHGVSAVDGYSVWAVGNNGDIVYTDDGNNWSLQAGDTTRDLNSIHAVDASYAYAVGVLGTIEKTINSGTAWSLQNSDTTNTLNDVFFLNRTVGWAVGENSTIVFTSDGGVNWDRTSVGSGVNFESVVFSDSTGFAVGSGLIYRTLDGTNWEPYRTDRVYIDFHLGEVMADATSGSEYYDSTLEDSLVGLPSANRLRIVQDIKVSEGWPIPADYVSDGTVQHYTSEIARILRSPGQYNILTANITDTRRVVRTLQELNSLIGEGGIDASAIADGAIKPSKLDSSADYTFGSINVLRDGTIGGNFSIAGTLQVQNFDVIGNTLNLGGSLTIGDSTKPYDSTFTLFGQTVQRHDQDVPAYTLTADSSVTKPLFNIDSSGTGEIFHISRNVDSSNCLLDLTSQGPGNGICINHTGAQGNIISVTDSGSGVVLQVNKASGQILDVTSATTGPFFNISSTSSSISTIFKIDQTKGTAIDLSLSDGTGLNLRSTGPSSDIVVNHGSSYGRALDVTSSGFGGALNIDNLGGVAVFIHQQVNETALIIDKDETNQGKALEVNNRGSDVGLGVYNTGSGVGQIISHVGDSTQPGLDIFVAGYESGPALRINKSNDTTGEVVKLWNQGFSETLYISQDRTDSSASVILIQNRSQGLDASSEFWRIDRSGNFFTRNDASATVFAFDTTHYLSAGSIRLDASKLDASNPGILGQVYQDLGYIRISDGTNVQPSVQGSTGPQGTTGVGGVTGPAGGPQGVTGLQGPTGVGVTGPAGGPQGYTGLMGPTGIQGETGVQGHTGVAGSTGLMGPTGTQGETGVQGHTGVAGSTGLGSTGIQGQTGLQGETGIQGQTGIGIQGQTGTQGQTGVGTQGQTGVGTQGQTGVGTQGQTGVGTQGQTGTKGETGVGIQGQTGVGTQGQTGVGTQGQTGVGIQGQTGLQGETGVGAQGQTGVGIQGQTGAQGDPGIQGQTGIGIQGQTGIGSQGITGSQGPTGDTGIQGATGNQGATGVGTPGSQGVTGIQGATGTGGGAAFANILPLGLPTDGTFSGIFPFDASTMTTNAVDQINDLLLAISPTPPDPLSGSLTLTNTVKYSAIIPTGLSSAWYQDGKTAGSVISDYVVDNTYNLSSPNIATSFKGGSTFGGDVGQVIHVEDGTNGSSRDMSSGVGITGNIEITSLSTYNTIWRKANARINFTQSTDGYKYHSMKYVVGAATQQTSDTKFWYDDSNLSPVFLSDTTVTEAALTSSRYLSGVRYYYVGDQFNVYAQIANLGNKGIRQVDPVSYSMTGLSSVNKTINGATFAFTDSYTLSDTSVALNATSAYSSNARMTVTGRKPNGTNQSNQSPSENRLINTFSTTYSSNGDITMYDENYRFPTSTDFSSVPVSITGNWNSSTPLSNGNGQLYDGLWTYPTINYSSGYLPTQSVNYSSFSGSQYIIWASNIGSAHSSMRIVFTGVNYTDISPSGTGNLNLEICLPSSTGWLDAGRDYGDGNGCRLGTSSGTTLNMTFGTASSSDSTGVVFIRTTLRNASATRASRMTITGT